MHPRLSRVKSAPMAGAAFTKHGLPDRQKPAETFVVCCAAGDGLQASRRGCRVTLGIRQVRSQSRSDRRPFQRLPSRLTPPGQATRSSPPHWRTPEMAHGAVSEPGGRGAGSPINLGSCCNQVRTSRYWQVETSHWDVSEVGARSGLRGDVHPDVAVSARSGAIQYGTSALPALRATYARASLAGVGCG